ncbi:MULTISPECIES: NAD(P)H-dependent flavin oxidoreductase [Aerococcus]|uniref:Probable nitronate monooxygenase n=1 Tax=Aerococcus loyolae TaxID=2976809 RepID=A0ABT4C092_9LACT|nr:MULTISPECIES: nitronate monooxygenase [Aerococcus]MCY3024951.1 nitronate monooxygenase [Aerococcus loyolae]MCY3026993.1 nitronate monooxygenase [Aerococcus loyolae]MCY3028577.1 nitronate monooxygenase [Aerococcus loyolae]MDK6231549.1 nitronate monooxygenase [Aerococcus urinae]MDK6257547.1 nitronate monooxygenase [Aerococcus urinae]
MSMTDVCNMLNIKYPIFCGAMGGISRPELVAAVSNAGGMGILMTAGMKDEAKIREAVQKTRELTDKPFGANVAIISGNAKEVLEVLIDEGVKFFTTGAGDPVPFIDMIHEAGAKIFPVVPSARVARKVEDAGADGVVVEGMEAGGHVGQATTMTLTRQAVEAVDHVPVIAAGGIADGHGLAAAYALGADGVQVGTVLVASTEAPIHDNYKQAIVDANDTATFVSGSMTGAPIRIEKNAAAKKHHDMDMDPDVDVKAIEAYTIPSLTKAAADGDVKEEIVTYGQIAGLVHEVRPVKEIIESIFQEANEVIDALADKKI